LRLTSTQKGSIILPHFTKTILQTFGSWFVLESYFTRCLVSGLLITIIPGESVSYKLVHNDGGDETANKRKTTCRSLTWRTSSPFNWTNPTWIQEDKQFLLKS
jgi:hypothetical protein